MAPEKESEESLRATFTPVPLREIEKSLSQHLSSLPSAVDSFLETHILESSHYTITLSEREAGFASVYKGSLLTEFFLAPAFRRYAQDVFTQLKRLEEVQSAFVPTCNELFLAHVLDGYRSVVNQAYFFSLPASDELAPASSCELRQATTDDIGTVWESTGGFFGDDASIEGKINRSELFLIYEGDACVAFGIIEKSRLLASTASIGMFVMPVARQKGLGTETLRLLIAECQALGLRPVAGCWTYNHLSKKTLERAGMVTHTRLLKFDF